jgi:hypothetical protein
MRNLAAATLIASALSAQGQAADPGVEFAFMPSTMTVTLLNEGGKYVAVDMKHIAQGATCRMDKDAIIARVGAGASAGTTRVRYAVQSWDNPHSSSALLTSSDTMAKGRPAVDRCAPNLGFTN